MTHARGGALTLPRSDSDGGRTAVVIAAPVAQWWPKQCWPSGNSLAGSPGSAGISFPFGPAWTDFGSWGAVAGSGDRSTFSPSCARTVRSGLGPGPSREWPPTPTSLAHNACPCSSHATHTHMQHMNRTISQVPRCGRRTDPKTRWCAPCAVAHPGETRRPQSPVTAAAAAAAAAAAPAAASCSDRIRNRNPGRRTHNLRSEHVDPPEAAQGMGEKVQQQGRGSEEGVRGDRTAGDCPPIGPQQNEIWSSTLPNESAVVRESVPRGAPPPPSR